MQCRAIAQEKDCPFGNDCKYDHDIPAYFARREPDIGPMCPVWDVHGYCPVGLNCRWARSHITDDLKLVYKEEKIPIEEVGLTSGMNESGMSLEMSLISYERRRTHFSVDLLRIRTIVLSIFMERYTLLLLQLLETSLFVVSVWNTEQILLAVKWPCVAIY